MVVSLYICEIPKNVTKKDIENIFCEFDGYKETRMKGNDADKRKIAFVDYEAESNGRFALETLNGFKFSVNDKGIFIKFSDNNKTGDDHPDKSKSKYLNKKRNDSKSPESDRERYKKKRYDDSNNSSSHYKKDDYEKRNNNNSQNNNSSRKSYNSNNTNSNTQNANFNSNSYNNLPNSNDNNNLNVLTDFVSLLQNAQALNLLNNYNSLPAGNNNNSNQIVDNPTLSNLGNILGNLANNNTNTNSNNQLTNNTTSNLGNFMKYDNELKKLMDFPKSATNIVYVEGFPYETSEREISHIFRPFSGFLSVRLITKEKNGEKTLICFADFENVIQSSTCIYTLQGYRFDKNDLVGLHFSYGVNKQKK